MKSGRKKLKTTHIRLFTNGGVQRGFAPLLRAWGYPPTSNSPRLGDRGLKED
jgi:hypothetical protein